MSWHGFEHFYYSSLEAVCFCLLRLKSGDTTEKILKPLAVLLIIMIYPTLPLIAKLKQVRQYFSGHYCPAPQAAGKAYPRQ
jgi:hypothetical protein